MRWNPANTRVAGALTAKHPRGTRGVFTTSEWGHAVTIEWEDRDDAGRDDLLALIEGRKPATRPTEWWAVAVSVGYLALQICWWLK
jgi:hypothetical protein